MSAKENKMTEKMKKLTTETQNNQITQWLQAIQNYHTELQNETEWTWKHAKQPQRATRWL